MNQLAKLQTLTPAEIFSKENVDTILNKIKDESKAVESDISTEKGRKEVASLAYKIAQSKTFMDDCGKKLGEDAKKTLDTINAERKKIRDTLDALKEEVRKPLTDWEEKEELRKTTLKNKLSAIEQCGHYTDKNYLTMSFDEINLNLTGVTNSKQLDWQEFSEDANTVISVAIERINKALEMKKQYEEQQEELRVLRAEKEARDKAESERIAKEVEEASLKAEEETKLRLEAQAKKEEQEREEKRIAREKELAREKEAAIKKEKEESARKLKEAEEKAKRDQEQAVERERQRVEKQKQELEEAERKRQANIKHRAKINNEVLEALKLSGASEEIGKKIITAIVSGEVPHTKISY